MRCDYFVGIPGTLVYITQEIEWGLQHFRHDVEGENIHYERGPDYVALLDRKKLVCLKRQGGVVVRDNAEDVNVLELLWSLDFSRF